MTKPCVRWALVAFPSISFLLSAWAAGAQDYPGYPGTADPSRGAATYAGVDFLPDPNDPAAKACDGLADLPGDPHRVGAGVGFDKIDTVQALPVCKQAAERAPVRPRYQYLYGRVLNVARRASEAADQFTRADRAGYGYASFALAQLYADGSGVTKNSEQAVRLYFQAGNAGVADAFAEGGELYATEDPPNYIEAKSWFEHAVQGGSADGFADLGLIYESGLGVAKNPSMAMSLYDEAAKRGSVQGMFHLGLAYRDGLSGTKDPQTGCQWLLKAAEVGHAYAEQETGRCYYNGEGMARDHQAAFNWFAKAGGAGLVDSRVFVADMLDSGDGWNVDKTAAAEWYRAAATDSGDVYAMTQLGAHLRLGEGVPKNEAEAMQWFAKAAEKGYAPAETSLALGYETGGGQEQDYAQAAHWFGLAAEKGDGSAELNLGMMNEKGLGMPRNVVRAKQLYAQAAANSNDQIATLGSQYFSNIQDSAPPRQAPQSSLSANVDGSASSSDSTNFWTAVIVGAIGIAALSVLTSGGSGSGASDTGASGETPSSGSSGLYWEQQGYSTWGQYTHANCLANTTAANPTWC